MLKKNLFAIAIVTLGLVMAINTFGQDRGKRPDKKNPEISRADAKIELMYVANQEEYMAGGIADVRGGIKDKKEETAKSSTARKKQTPKPNAGFMDYTDDACSVCDGKVKATSIKSPRDVATGQSNQRTKPNSQDKLGNFEIQGIKSPRDVATGQATGKRQHKP